MLELDHKSHTSAAREIIACEGPERAQYLLNTKRGRDAFQAALAAELRRLPEGEPNRTATLRRWRDEARR